MPGILPMKVIKVGSNSQSRIAQACDRCRSKKIRCDGVTPCCTQCKNVGFECKTSDKLSRRAFPRGYTESLEERVRTLESEVRELKELLDEKDEKIDLLSKIESFSHKRPSVSSATSPTADSPIAPKQEPLENTFKVQQTSILQKSEHRSDPFFIGASSARIFIDTVRSKIQENGTCVSSIDATALIGRCDLAKPAKRADLPKNISRLASDQLVNVFFQEWSPLFPILHRPTFLNIYSDYVNDTGVAPNAISIAQLHLVFGIAALASESNKELLSYFEAQWQGALGSIMNETKLATLQCLVLAQLYCIVRGDSNKLVFYSGLAANMCNRLGLHQSQKRFSLGALTCETRKKVFWSLYTLDAFGAIFLGLPKLLKDEDIETEEPSDVDDENVNEQGFQPTLPGESTKLSSALALFKLARILSKVSTELYPAASTYHLSMQSIGTLSAELDEWRNNLAPHLRLEFAKDKPSTNVISSRCPLLGLFYYFVRMLIHRPVLHSDLSTSASSSILATAESSQHIIQILQLLQERNLSYTVCINKPELILTCAFGLMYQMSELPESSKLRKDIQQLITVCVDLLEKAGTPAVISFRKIARLFQSQPERSPSTRVSPKPSQELKSNKGQLQAISASLSCSNTKSSKLRDQLSLKTIHLNQNGTSLYNAHHGGILTPHQTTREASTCSITSEPNLKHRTSTSTLSPVSPTNCGGMPNLDYLSFGTPDSIILPGEIKARPDHPVADWDRLLSSFDPAEPAFSPSYPVRHSNDPSYQVPPVPLDWHLEWNNPEEWTIFDLPSQEQPISAKSVLSFSDESTSGEDLSSCDMGSEFRGYSIPNEDYYSLPHTSLTSTKA